MGKQQEEEERSDNASWKRGLVAKQKHNCAYIWKRRIEESR